MGYVNVYKSTTDITHHRILMNALVMYRYLMIEIS